MKTMTSLILGIVAAAAVNAGAETLEDRIKPSGSLCMAGDPCASAAPMQVVAAATGSTRSGKEVYDSKCATCHTTGAAGAPKTGDAAAWSTRLGKGMEVLYANAINGINAMPAKGLCFDCSSEEIKASVDYMMESSK